MTIKILITIHEDNFSSICDVKMGLSDKEDYYNTAQVSKSGQTPVSDPPPIFEMVQLEASSPGSDWAF